MSSFVAGCLTRLNAAKRGLGLGAAILSITAPAAGPRHAHDGNARAPVTAGQGEDGLARHAPATHRLWGP